MRRLFLIVVLALNSGCALRMKHRWENGFTCKCRGNLIKGEATCDCGPTQPPKCPEAPKKK